MAEERPFVRPALMVLASAPASAPLVASTAVLGPVAAVDTPTVVTPVVPRRSRRWAVVAAAGGVLVLLVLLVLVVPRGGHRTPAGGSATDGAPGTAPGFPGGGVSSLPGGPPGAPASTARGTTSARGPAAGGTTGPAATHSAGVVPTTGGAATTAPGGTTAPTVNVALHKPTGESSHAQVYAGGNAIDGDANSYWESTDGAFPQWLQVDLGSAVPVDHVVVRLPPQSTWQARTQTLSVQGSTDAAAFRTLVGSATYSFDVASGNLATIHVGGAQARFVRLLFTDNSVQQGGQISELQVY